MEENKIGQRIKDARKAAGLTQKQLADRIHKSFSSVQKYEMSKATPPIEVLQDIAHVLGVSWITLAGSGDEPLYSIDCFEAAEKMRYSPQDVDLEVKKILEKSDLIHRVIVSMDKLNERGLRIAAERVAELTKIPEYRKDNE